MPPDNRQAGTRVAWEGYIPEDLANLDETE